MTTWSNEGASGKGGITPLCGIGVVMRHWGHISTIDIYEPLLSKLALLRRGEIIVLSGFLDRFLRFENENWEQNLFTF
jgi:hypothetical protein